MIREIREVNKNDICTEVDITLENGLYHSCLKPGDGLIRDMIDTLVAKRHHIVTANQIGRLKKALVVRAPEGLLVILNPVVQLKSGNQVAGFYKKIRLEYTSIDGRTHFTKFEGKYSKAIQYALRMLGYKI